METACNLESVVDPPLETSKRADHDDTGTETVPEAFEADAAVNLANRAALLVHNGNHGVSGVRHDSAENTSPVASKEGDHQLSVLGVGFAGSGEDVLVESTDSLLKSDELDDGVRDLSAPQWHDTLVEAWPAFRLHDLWPSLAEGGWEGTFVRGLDSDFNLHKKS